MATVNNFQDTHGPATDKLTPDTVKLFMWSNLNQGWLPQKRWGNRLTPRGAMISASNEATVDVARNRTWAKRGSCRLSALQFGSTGPSFLLRDKLIENSGKPMLFRTKRGSVCGEGTTTFSQILKMFFSNTKTILFDHMKAKKRADGEVSAKPNVEDAVAVAGMLQANNVVTNLTISVSAIGDVGATAMAEALSRNTTLTSLSLVKCEIDSFGALAIAQSLVRRGRDNAPLVYAKSQDGMTGNSTLTSLSLAGNKIGEYGAEGLAMAIVNNRSLKEIDIAQTLGICEEGFTRLFDALAYEDASVTSFLCTLPKVWPKVMDAMNKACYGGLLKLCLKGSPLGLAGVEFISAGMVKKNVLHTLKTLGLERTNLDMDGVSCMAHMLKSNTTLTSLNLKANNMLELGCKKLCHALASNSTLEMLDISENDVGDSGAKYMADVIGGKKAALTHLVIADNYLTDQGAMFLAVGIAQGRRLRALDVSKNKIEDAGLVAIATAVGASMSMTSLNIADNDMGEEAATAIGQAVYDNARMMHVKVPRMGDAGSARMGHALLRTPRPPGFVIEGACLCDGVAKWGIYDMMGSQGTNCVKRALLLGMERGDWRKSDDVLVAVVEEVQRRKMLALAMGAHARLGTASMQSLSCGALDVLLQCVWGVEKGL